jgi:hypothetical protein
MSQAHGLHRCKGRGQASSSSSVHSTTPDLFAPLFHSVINYKRLSPGQITDGAGQVDHDPRDWIITHDASTLDEPHWVGGDS